ncbi:MAG: putative capsular polysaccharide synthesis family protein [Pseudomonadota bacterium]
MRTPIVYTMGKVGSSAISAAIRQSGRVVHDIHTLNDDALLAGMRKALDKGQFPNPHICVSMAWKSREISVPQRCVYISLVRDPIARNISAYFQNLGTFIDTLEAGTDSEAEDLFVDFMDRYPHFFPVKWYEREYAQHLGIDVFQGRFRHQAGYQLSHHERIVIFKTDTPDEVKSSVLTRVLGFTVDVRPTHASADKDYADDYDAVRSLARFEPALLDRVYGSAFVKHFWESDAIEQMRAKWLKPNTQI